MNCPICKTEFDGRRNKIYCGKKCKRRVKMKRRAERRWKSFIKNNPSFADLKEFSAEDLHTFNLEDLKPWGEVIKGEF